MTKITEKNLIKANYVKYPTWGDNSECMYQKRIKHGDTTHYFINFRKWSYGEVTFDCQLHCDTSTGGYLWATFKENGIEESEARAEVLWKAAGGVHYD